MKNKWLLFLIMPISAIADELLTSNVSNGCSNDFYTDTSFVATFTPSKYQCNSGYYLPANSDHCVICPNIYDCDGGTFAFNENIDQGNKLKSQITENIINGCETDLHNTAIIAEYAPNQYDCSVGYYLPANIDECTLCPANSYCGGGTYTFNENIDQGINPCPDNKTSLAGSSVVSQCATITVVWVSEDETYETTTCTINGELTLPTPPTRVGYMFTGWKVKAINNE